MSKASEITRKEIIGKHAPTPIWKAILVEHRIIPYRYSYILNGIMTKLRTRKALRTPPVTLNTNSDVEIHMLLNEPYVYLGILALKSFLRFYKNINVLIHDDGSLTENNKKILREHIKGIKIIDLKIANEMLMDNLALSKIFCRKNIPIFFPHNPVTALKLDVAFTTQKNKIILFDSDILFFRPPIEIVNWIENRTLGQTNLYLQSSGFNNVFGKKILEEEFELVSFQIKINQ